MDTRHKDCQSLLEYVGGKDNISSVMHCMTRMRFVLKDTQKADVEKIHALESVKVDTFLAHFACTSPSLSIAKYLEIQP